MGFKWLCWTRVQYLVNTQSGSMAWIICNLVNRNFSETWILRFFWTDWLALNFLVSKFEYLQSNYDTVIYFIKWRTLSVAAIIIIIMCNTLKLEYVLRNLSILLSIDHFRKYIFKISIYFWTKLIKTYCKIPCSSFK